MDIRDRSEEELARILAYLADRNDGDNPTVLVGGWAVYAYNPYEKSTDIDLVLNSKRRARLLHWLQSHHGYERIKKQRDGWQGTWKDFEGSDDDPRERRIFLDIAGYNEEQFFEGRPERLDFSLVKDHWVNRSVGGLPVRMALTLNS